MSEPMDADVDAVDQQALADQWAAALEDQVEDAPEVAAPSPTYQPAALPALESSPQSASSEMNLDVILDIPVTLSIELGRTRVPIRNLMQLNQGSVVELDRIAGEPLDV
ncbi:MAG TPA: FliM/FliN family flagellar motor switch protein, partial [Porticoccaceae bacterium]|nr:FliM/FliN family flagellar motor switch protein [Porticoccaceae bacterium]